MENAVSSFLGRLSRGIVHRLVKVYYPHIEVTGREQIPGTGPVLLCGNHPNSLMDPIVVGIGADRPVRFMAKAPLFKTPVLGPIMHGMGMIPAYRGSDDSKQVRKNLESLDSIAKILVEGHAVGIFPEGKSHDAMQVEMVRSGVARIAVQVVEQGVSELVVVPLGLNYYRKEQFRSSIWIQVGQPIRVESWLREQGETGRKAIRALTEEVERRLKSVVVHLDEPGWEALVEDLEVLVQNELQLKSLHRRKQVADAMNFFLSTDRPRAEAIAAEVRTHRESVKACGLTMNSPVLGASGLRLFGIILGRIAVLLLGLLPAFAGLFFHVVPFSVVRLIAYFITPPNRTAVSFYRLLVGLPVYAFWYVVAGIAATWMVVPTWSIVVSILLLPVTGIIALGYWPHAWEYASRSWRQLRFLSNRENCENLRLERESLRSQLIMMAEQYIQRSSADAD